VLLRSAAEIGDVRGRVEAAGLPAEPYGAQGFLVRDPWETAVAFDVAPNAAA